MTSVSPTNENEDKDELDTIISSLVMAHVTAAKLFKKENPLSSNEEIAVHVNGFMVRFKREAKASLDRLMNQRVIEELEALWSQSTINTKIEKRIAQLRQDKENI